MNRGPAYCSLYMSSGPRIHSNHRYLHLLSLIVTVICLVDATPTICTYSREESVKVSWSDSDEVTNAQTDGADEEWLSKGHQVCPEKHRSCYSLWSEDLSANGTRLVLSQGCWEASSENECLSSDCVSNKRPGKALKNNTITNTKFCCCSGSQCNFNMTDGYDPANESHGDGDIMPAFHLVETADYDSRLVTVISVASVLLLLAVVVLSAYRLWSSMYATEDRKRKLGLDSVHLTESQSSHLSLSTIAWDLETLKLETSIGHGRFGSVYKGTLKEQTVAVKVFSCQQRQYYLNEKDVYLLPLMDHPSLPRLFGAQEHVTDDGTGRLEYHLVITYASAGCLQSYLRSKTMDWAALCRLVQTMASGLAYLHSEVKKGDKTKPCTAHRDLSSRNILVKEDGSSLICDFGFALRISGPKCVVNGVEQLAETNSLSDVGTLRYMAPEILEGAVNLRDCESSLKQIDMYALGLIIWEIATRCSDLYQGMQVPEYKLPFEQELGGQPTYEQMQVLVTRHKARPLFPDIWKDSNPAIRSLKETIEDCWDHDAEARLTALCVEERLLDLPLLWDRHKNGNVNHAAVSCLLSLSSNAALNQTNGFNNQRNILSLRNNGVQASEGPSIAEKVTNQLNVSRETVVSIVSPSSGSGGGGESEKNVLCAAANAFNFHQVPKVSLPLQPYQGRNPCLERNLMQETSDDGSGHKFLEQGLKFQPNNRSGDGSSSWSDMSAPENRCLVPGNRGTATRAMPIPHSIQNAISVAIPKQPNLPGNGHHSTPASSVAASSSADAESSWPSAFRKKWTKTSTGFKSLFTRRRTEDGVAEETEPLSASLFSPTQLQPQHQQRQQPQPQTNLQPHLYPQTQSLSQVFTTDHPRNTHVSLVNGSATTRLVNDGEEIQQEDRPPSLPPSNTVPKSGLN